MTDINRALVEGDLEWLRAALPKMHPNLHGLNPPEMIAANEAINARIDRILAALERRSGDVVGHSHDMHGGYGQCGGSGAVWVDDGENSNFYRHGTCPRCAPAAPSPSGEQT